MKIETIANGGQLGQCHESCQVFQEIKDGAEESVQHSIIQYGQPAGYERVKECPFFVEVDECRIKVRIITEQ